MATHALRHGKLRAELLRQAVVAQLDEVRLGQENVQRFDISGGGETHCRYGEEERKLDVDRKNTTHLTCVRSQPCECEKQPRLFGTSTIRPPRRHLKFKTQLTKRTAASS